jgi:hypothetical protein
MRPEVLASDRPDRLSLFDDVHAVILKRLVGIGRAVIEEGAPIVVDPS